jgi:hypothetical protein
MKTKSIAAALIVISLSIMGIIFPFTVALENWLPLYDDTSPKRLVGIIAIDPDHAHYATLANVGEHKGHFSYELKAYNPAGVPMYVTWGMLKADSNGNLSFNNKFDPYTLAWIKDYGTTATYSVRHQ